MIGTCAGGLGIKQLGFKRALATDTDRPAYDPRDLLKLYLYGYLNKLRSSRKLMTKCRQNLEPIYLLKG